MPDDFERTWDGQPISKEPPHGCAVIVYRLQGDDLEYLVLRRSQVARGSGEWEWGPPAGARLPGEPEDRCAERELREESGLSLDCRRVLIGDESWWHYVAEAPADAVVTLSVEHDEYRWMPAPDAATLVLPEFIGERMREADALIRAEHGEG